MIQKFISNLSENEKKVFYVTVLFVLLACFDRLFLGPVLSKLYTIDNEISIQEQSVIRDIRFLAYKDKIVRELKVYENYINKDQKDADIVNADFLSVVERLATKTKVNLVKSNPSEVKHEKDFDKYYANLDCVGTLEDVLTFMHEINSTEELLKVVKFNMSPKRGVENTVNVSMSVVKVSIGSRSSKEIAANK
ncbi:MAG: hypothetical protein A2Y03_08255 [Omnitrophica WOR_2 bacterium GWF2_38_59]|nr:MAG: hypothetical protein A2Y06_01465 [Omnitrophica WOR_2 bacterium GWA2_37_7]OGX25484.1 MAG: hypothetical protein A2Y03_08255 [Omnitrophica WOR_2 bacterium GWF2_38_59]OGX48124.1 MAG: hypothetical protein A2243_02920 [Omnitrophica WOR_2 bacterium RIFOXYA2_FULL_38_17]OGX54725.1 MAG: hypothetical protein A2267_08430 [Omnitrophica WOR_2 bacterium RIFOXYA12_FULL_38_10]OGX56404.1 MAG: hypothetical protein A2447_10410 [Omnitrophica WOR_2 bacterium RIFOXYC2_FULL_38_12]OGX58460.1 MAG: hypothetical 